MAAHRPGLTQALDLLGELVSSTEFEARSDEQTLTPSRSKAPVFFPVSLTKLFLLSLCTLSLYQIYWFYKNWHFVKRRENSDIVPAARSILAVFFCYSLFKKISEHSVKTGDKPVLAGVLGTSWIITNVLSILPDPYWLVSFLAVVFMLPIQSAVNSMNSKLAPDHDKNDRFSGWNIFGLIFGGLFLLLGVIGTFLPAEQV